MSVTVRMSDGMLAVGNAGEQFLIGGAEKAAQDTLMDLLKPYDADLDNGNEMFDENGDFSHVTVNALTGAAAIQSYLQSCLQRTQQHQRENADLDPAEQIQSIDAVIVRQLDNDPTHYGFYVALTVDDQQIAMARAVSLRHLGDTPFPLVGGADPT